MDERKPNWFDADLEERRDPSLREAIEWFNRLRADRVSESDRRAFEAWIHDDPAHARAFEEIQQLWDGISGLPEVRRRRRKAVTRRMVGKGALAVALIGGTWGLYRTHPFADYRTGVGERRIVTLADGSRVELSTSTVLSVDMRPALRRISLHKGEAFFEVRPGADRPFVVETGSGRVTALGTAFSVAETEDHMLVTVTQHAVRIDAAARYQRVEAGMQAAFDTRGIAAPAAVDASEALAWREGRLIFVNSRLGNVVSALNRWRSGHLAVINDALAEHPVTLIVNLEDVDDALRQLQDALPLTLTNVTPYLTLIHAR